MECYSTYKVYCYINILYVCYRKTNRNWLNNDKIELFYSLVRYKMIYTVLITLLLALITIIAGIVFAYKKLTHRHFALLILILVVSPVAAFKFYERGFKLSVVPDALQVDSISYSKEESWGFGPGGNEAGIRVYPLSDEIANQIMKRGIEFFNNLPANNDQKNRRWRGRYESWNETPIKESKYWKQKGGGGLDMYDYICRYGFCIEIDNEVISQATDIINSEGSYYAYGRIGLIVVSPAKNLVIYMYNG